MELIMLPKFIEGIEPEPLPLDPDPDPDPDPVFEPDELPLLPPMDGVTLCEIPWLIAFGLNEPEDPDPDPDPDPVPLPVPDEPPLLPPIVGVLLCDNPWLMVFGLNEPEEPEEPPELPPVKGEKVKRNGNQNMHRNFKNATFYVDCFLYWVDLMLFPIQYFILSCDKQQLTEKRILLRRFILTLPWRSHFQ